MAALRSGLLGVIVSMSIDTLRTNKMRSALTVLGASLSRYQGLASGSHRSVRYE
jgi:hypothetical protein